MPTIEEFIDRFCEEGEEDTVGENLTLNRGPAKPEDLDVMQQNIPDGTVSHTKWGFGDDVQRIWVNPHYPFFAAFSALSHSIHVWRYPSRVPFLRHMDEVAEFFGSRPFDGLKHMLDSLNDAKADEAMMDGTVREALTIHDPKVCEAVLGPILDASPREFQVELMMDELAK